MILTVDIGNSNTVFVGYDKDRNLLFEHRVLTFRNNTQELLEALLQQLNLDVESIIISCVVPSILDDVCLAFESTYGIKPIFINGSTIDGVVVNIKNPLELGADLIATFVGAYTKVKTPVIIADIGTASKITLVNEKNEYEGGIILPGMGVSLQSMVDKIPQLPKVDLILPDSVMGKGTIHAIQSGMLYGTVAQIEGLANRIEKEVGQPCTRLLTGGYTTIFKHLLPDFIYEEHLVNDGLLEIYLNKMYK